MEGQGRGYFGKMMVKAIMCAIAGVIGWLLVEPSMPSNIGDPAWASRERVMVLLVCLLVGAAAGLYSGLQRGSSRHVWTSSSLGAALGAAGGLLGYEIGGISANVIFGPDIFSRGAPIPIAIIARIIVIAPLGLCLGGAIGATNLSLRGLIAGAVGGLGGGAVAGALFDISSFMFAPLKLLMAHGNEVGAPGRAETFLLLGFFVGLFTGILDLVTRQAWVRLVVGRNEGREWPLDTAQTTFGRDERAMVPLWGDDSVAPLHATIVKQGSEYVLQDAGTPMGVGINGMRIAGPTPLRPGDQFQIGSHNLMFMTKGAGQVAQQSRQPIIPMQPAQLFQPSVPVQARPDVNTGAYVPGGQTNPLAATVQARSVTLVATTGPLTGQRFSVSGPMDAGREAPGITLGFDGKASRRHASFAPTPGGLTVQDLGSTNGTFVNGQRINSANLKLGDTVQIGATIFRVE